MDHHPLRGQKSTTISIRRAGIVNDRRTVGQFHSAQLSFSDFYPKKKRCWPRNGDELFLVLTP